MLGASGTNVTTTPGGGPVPYTEDVVSSYVASVAKGELTVTDFTDCVSDGEDIIQYSFTSSFLRPLPKPQYHNLKFVELGQPQQRIVRQLILVPDYLLDSLQAIPRPAAFGTFLNHSSSFVENSPKLVSTPAVDLSPLL